jgi:hypothetical protein
MTILLKNQFQHHILEQRRGWKTAVIIISFITFLLFAMFGEVKDGLQEVQETLLPRKCPSASERHLHPQVIHKEK